MSGIGRCRGHPVEIFLNTRQNSSAGRVTKTLPLDHILTIVTAERGTVNTTSPAESPHGASSVRKVQSSGVQSG